MDGYLSAVSGPRSDQFSENERRENCELRDYGQEQIKVVTLVIL